MILIPDDPIVRCIERTGYPPWWHQPDYPDYLFNNEDEEECEEEEDEEEK